jgi:predicted nucleic acid-binding protein
MSRIALDTNILAYSEGLARSPGDGPKIASSRLLIERLLQAGNQPVLAVPCLSELHNVLVRKARLSPSEASQRSADIGKVSEVLPVTAADLDAAFGLATDHGLQIFDALILSVVAEARCDLLVSEDMHDGFSWRGVVITNPFGPAPDPRVANLIHITP